MKRRTKKGWVLTSPRTGRRLGGPYRTKKAVEKRERQVNYWKHQKRG